MDYMKNIRTLIESSDGVITDNLFVEKPGVLLLASTSLSPDADALFDKLNIDVGKKPYQQIGEFSGRLTYNNFQSTMKDSENYTKAMVEEHQHLSVFSGIEVMFLIAGVSIETVLEFVAHHEGKIVRLTSSKTKAMDNTLYRVQGTKEQRDQQKSFIKRVHTLRSNVDHTLPTELHNQLNLCNKASVLTISMSLKDWHKTLIGRLSNEGVEMEVIEVCEIIAKKLNALYPNVIKTPEHYFAQSNGKKYRL